MRLKVDSDRVRISTKNTMLRAGSGSPCSFSMTNNSRSQSKYSAMPTPVNRTISMGSLRIEVHGAAGEVTGQ
jgi:hypothetical protein